MSTGADCKSQTAPMRNSVAALYAERERQAFFSAVSHDIRPPLNTIVGCSELLMADGTTEEDRRQYLSTIRSSGMMLARLVDDIFDLSKLKSGTLAIIKEPTDVPALVHRVFEVVRTAYPVKRLAVVEDVAPKPPSRNFGCRMCDKTMMKKKIGPSAFSRTARLACCARERTWRLAVGGLTAVHVGLGVLSAMADVSIAGGGLRGDSPYYLLPRCGMRTLFM